MPLSSGRAGSGAFPRALVSKVLLYPPEVAAPIPVTETPRPFVISLRRRWVLAILPILCVLYFVAVLVIVLRDVRTGVSTDLLVLGGVGLFAFTVLFEIPFFFRRRRARARPEPEAEPEFQDEPPEPMARAPTDDEYLKTAESQQGLRVLEYSRPAKSRNRGAVYAKTYVPVTGDHVLRIETLAADTRDL